MTSFILFIGGPEILIIMLVVVMLFGSKKIPEIARALGIRREIRSSANTVNEEAQKVEKDLKNN